MGADYRRPVSPSNQITCFNERYYCHSLYQAKGAYAHLNQHSEKYIEYSVDAAIDIVFYDDPFNLVITYIFFLERLTEPPDGALKKTLTYSYNILIFISSSEGLDCTLV